MNNQNNVSSTQQITTFVDDVVPTVYTKPLVSTDPSWLQTGAEDLNHSIKDILRRPVEVTNFELNTNFTDLSFEFPDVLLQNSANVVDKLNYFTLFRADIHVKIVFNATPFMQGKYWVYFAPFDTRSNRMRTGAIANATGYPGVELDIANGAPVELVIPYCSPLSHYRLTNEESTMGELVITPLSNLTSGTTGDSATATLFAWFENIELSLPTGHPVSVPTLQAQGEEEERTERGLISATANVVANAAQSVGEMAPVARSFTQPLEWVSRAITGAASSLGFNKPSSVAANSPYANLPGKGYTHTDGLDLSQKLAASPDNCIAQKPGIFSSAVDEMDIDFVKKKSCCVQRNIPWNTNEPKGTRLFYWINAPSCLGDSSGNPGNPTTLAFLSSAFRYWRGGLKYRLSVAKTAFHTGRIRISYIPASNAPYATPGELSFNYNWILDLSKSSEIEFTVPYVSNRPWTEMRMAPRLNGWLGSRFSTGYLNIEILTPLKASSTSVSDSVSLQFWHCGADDFTLAVPSFDRCYPYDGTILEAQIFNETADSISHNEQISGEDPQMFAKPLDPTTDAEQLSIGEKITSLRQVIKKFGLTLYGANAPYRNGSDISVVGPVDPLLPDSDDVSMRIISIDPAYFGRNDILTPAAIQRSLFTVIGPNGDPQSPALFDVAYRLPPSSPLHYFSYLYRFYRGGKRYKLFLDSMSNYSANAPRIGTGDSQGFQVKSSRPDYPVLVKVASPADINGDIPAPSVDAGELTHVFPTFEHTVYPDLNGCVEFEVPYYSSLPISLVGEDTVDNSDGILIDRHKVFVSLGAFNDSLDVPSYQWQDGVEYPFSNNVFRPSIGSFRLMEAAADDFSFGYLIGAPKCYRVPL